MTFKGLCTELDNEFIRLRADQAELGQQLTERINGVANHVKTLDAKVTSLDAKIDTKFEEIDARFESVDARFETMDGKINNLQGNQNEMMNILIDIQRKVSAN
ncbi:hypothetical protein ABT120_01485 [Nonomuraea angiospora]|uniref:hypothetical protein n=1 Tax=Nonomuraea angiospora TaxID=46172 RepID=UPI0033190087